MWLFGMNVFWVSSIIGFIVGASMFGAITFLPLYLQIAKGATPTGSGLQLIPLTLGILTASTLAGRYMGKTGRYRLLPIVGMSLLLLGLLSLTQLSRETHIVVFSAMLIFVGLGMGCIFPVVTTAVQNAVPRETLGTATAAGILLRQTGGALGVAVFGALFSARLLAGLGAAAALLGGGADLGPQTMAKLTPEMQTTVAAAVIDAVHPIFWILSAMALIGLCFAFVLEEVPLVNRAVPKGE
jgi:MFS family permease